MRKRERDNRIRRHLCYHYITLRIPSFQIEQIIDIFSCNSRMTSMSNDFESSRRAVLIGCSLISMANKNRSFALSIASTKSTPIVQSAYIMSSPESTFQIPNPIFKKRENNNDTTFTYSFESLFESLSITLTTITTAQLGQGPSQNTLVDDQCVQ